MGISIIIPSYNGGELLKECLPLLFDACGLFADEVEVIVVDDGGADDTERILKQSYPQVRYFKLTCNHGFGYACNFGVAQSKHEIVLILNNDVKIEKEFLLYLAEHFSEGNIFAVKIAIRSIGKEVEVRKGFYLKRYLEFKYGWIYSPYKEMPLVEGRKYTSNVAGCAVAFSKEKYLKLNGFDDLFLPFYSEETDLCYRALKRGLKIIYEPRSVVFHKEHETIFKYYSKLRIEMIGERNMYFLIWKNLGSRKLLFQHLVFIPLRILRGLFTGRLWPLMALLQALRRLPKILELRKIEKKEAVILDSEIFE